MPNARIYSGASEYTSFPGGMPRLKRFVEKNFNYPKEAWGEANRLSNSDLHFIVRRDGVACGLDGKDMHPAVYEEWKRVFRLMPLWEPAKIKGHPVDVKCHTRLHVYDQSSGLPFHIEREKSFVGTKNVHQILCGFTCMEGDRFFELNEQALEVGDRVIFEKVGAYTMGLSPQFIEFYPPVYAEKNGQIILARKKNTADKFIGE